MGNLYGKRNRGNPHLTSVSAGQEAKKWKILRRALSGLKKITIK
ncbi:hypothetical protein NB703_001115 [Pantoea ananatis]|uniref:Uncharacterized protein n=1 Tax=Pantoea ananas TaxID=553 RepID=A0AAJ1CWE1_PANAN|nr:hypothetical protein [Pantoea ananatis]MCW0310912.1 hypothetical protein [Pantoea ananatis]MCW0329346.1 hypothetical protein [Pantoea ananatis]MCW0338593.1 hypothetical protein [Pantoea ananatis]MCW0343022.1 hypothetical protein [Pantoea ananatis]